MKKMMKNPKGEVAERLSIIPEIMEDEEDTYDDSNKAIIPEPQFDPMGGGTPSADLEAKILEDSKPRSRTRGLTLTMAEVKMAYVHAHEKETVLEKTFTEIICDAFQTPMKCICMVTIPCIEDDKLEYVFVPALPITSVAATLILTGSRHCLPRIQHRGPWGSCTDMGGSDIDSYNRRSGHNEDEEGQEYSLDSDTLRLGYIDRLPQVGSGLCSRWHLCILP
jgi:hypothetical protein